MSILSVILEVYDDVKGETVSRVGTQRYLYLVRRESELVLLLELVKILI